MLAKPKLPAQFTGLDIESKSTELNAYILSFGLCKINMKKFRPDQVVGYELEADNEEAGKLFHTCPRTMGWWGKAGDPNDPYAPSLEAKALAFKGRFDHYEGIKVLHKFLHNFNNDNCVFTSRGPEFDMRIVENACKSYGLNWRLRFSNFDSDRTYERVGNALGVLPPTEKFVASYLGSQFVKHCAKSDAAFEAFNGARVLWLSAIANLDGRERMIEALKLMDENKFDPKEYVDRVEWV